MEESGKRRRDCPRFFVFSVIDEVWLNASVPVTWFR
jgi:hypothetical protein